MTPEKWQIILFESTRGEKYVEKFIKFLDKATIAKTLRIIDLLELYGPQLGMPHSKRINREIAELRIRGKVDVRIFYTVVGNKIYLLHAFQKKSQKTPTKEIELAKARLNELSP